MRLTVLGSAASYAGPGQACASHLIEGEEARVLFDCGNGSLANLGAVLDPTTLDAVFVTHCHPDHFLDLYALQALLRYAPDGPCEPLLLCVPYGLFERMGALLSERGRTELAAAFKVHELAEGEAVMVGDLVVTPCRVEHTADSFALVASDGDVTLCYTSDTALGPGVREAADGCDLLLAEATLPEAYRGRAPHLTAAEAAELARDAGAGELVLTHVWPTNDRERMVEEAAAIFAGPVVVARELDTLEVGSALLCERERKADS
ncbi:MAG: MBL fold metallo-hydrolase [Coriobacteriia bacterium]|jgi:ribonuclease BN (tRNA processing enzyme)|nr:MBL fold metallo-hydrolase [Coriobacteriia bacterium]